MVKIIGYTADDAALDSYKSYPALHRALKKASEQTKPAKGKHGCCTYCAIPLTKETATRDHVFPKSKGGQKTVKCCYNCNQEKKNMTLQEYLAYLIPLKIPGQKPPRISVKIRNVKRMILYHQSKIKA